MATTKASMREHIRELRTRLMFICVAFIVWCGIGYAVREPLTKLILKPLGQSVYYNTPQGGFEFFMRVIMTAGFICVVPVLVHQLLRFVEPAVNRRLTTKMMRRTLIWSLLLAIAGITFGYFMILPTSLQFFSDFGGNAVKPLISADAYLNFVLGILATFALLFQLPLIISIIDHIRPIKPQDLTRYRRHVIVGSLVIALLLPFTYDPVTQFVIALPIVLLFELSILIVRRNHRPTKAQKREIRITQLVEALKESDDSVIEQAAMQDTPKPAPAKQTTILQSGPSRPNTKPRPQVLDLRNAS